MINEKTFHAKFYTVVDQFKQWMPKNFDFSNSNILDFGCEYGVMTLAIALRLKPKKVIGIDINSYHKQLLEIIKDNINIEALPKNLEFYEVNAVDTYSYQCKFDVIFSWSTFEHINQPNLHEVVNNLYDCLSPNGFIFVQISPLYYSAFGSHLDTLINVPWAHLSMQNNLLHHQVMNSPKNDFYRDEDDNNYQKIKNSIWGCYETLNKITADDLIELFENNGFYTIKQIRTYCSQKPSKSLLRVFNKEILETEQVVALFKKQ